MANETTGTFIPMIPAHHLACCRCQHFRYEPALAWCVFRQAEFPALCVRYEYAKPSGISAAIDLQ